MELNLLLYQGAQFPRCAMMLSVGSGFWSYPWHPLFNPLGDPSRTRSP